ncbi:hypothetical protein [Rhodosalinus sediminis]|uniref:hypothetical protein n=1 Tax=Rhodosalinus sediminis TaxID=1940533 RepID=UPI0023531A50|nr:hypothetical protein [Rhodosalinus sediminis]
MTRTARETRRGAPEIRVPAHDPRSDRVEVPHAANGPATPVRSGRVPVSPGRRPRAMGTGAIPETRVDLDRPDAAHTPGGPASDTRTPPRDGPLSAPSDAPGARRATALRHGLIALAVVAAGALAVVLL